MKNLSLRFLIVFFLITNGILAQKTWTGATSTAWNTAGNWSPGGVPGSTDNVIIPSAPANQPLISGTSTPVCNNLTVNSGALLTISGTSAANAQITVSGTATFNGGLSIGGSISKTGKIVATNVVWNSTATLSDYLNARCEVSGNWTFSSGSSIDMGYCWLTFTGTGNSTITNNSANSKFSSLTVGKTSAATTYIGATSTAMLTITGALNINANNTLNGAANITTILQSNVVSNGVFKFDYGTVSLERASGTQQIDLLTTTNYFNSLKINCGGTVIINNTLSVMGNLTIQSGTFNPQNNTLYVTGNWINTVGPAYFTEGTGKVVFNIIINKDGGRDYDQVIQNAENFNILELNNAYGDLIINSGLVVVTCNQYDWVAGGLNVSQGVFTALDLAENGIFGRYTLSGTGTINLTNDDGYVDLNGATLNISGGTFNVYGGTTDSYWPFGGNSSITMSGGILNFAETGILVSSSTTTLTSNITGGTIKTAKNFNNSRADFNPTGGTIEMYGPTDASLYCVGTAALYGLKINKTASKGGEKSAIVYPRIDRETGEVLTDETRAQIVNLTSPVTLNGNFTLTSGTFNSNNHNIQAKRDWTNNVGAGSFNPGTGRVIFNGGNYHQICFNETFNILEVAKASGGSFRVNSGTVNCNQYDWTIGSIDVPGGTFTANDLADNAIYGNFGLQTGGTINLTNSDSYVDLSGNLNITGGNFNVYGGTSDSYWPFNNNASITMSGGILDFVNTGINLTVNPILTTNITGGTIRTSGSFTNLRSDFTPTGGTVELYGSTNTNLYMSVGNLRNLSVSKAPANTVTLTTNATINGTLNINTGTFSNTNKTLTIAGNINLNNGGILAHGAGSQLLMAAEMTMNVNNGGTFKAIGNSSNLASLSHSAGFYYIWVNSGGTVSAKYASFQYANNIIFGTGSAIDPLNPFDYCTFGNTSNTYLIINNDQTLTIRGANFSTLPASNNVSKTNNAGRIIFRDATGTYAGPAYEYDPYNRIDWVITQPGLWTGVVSANWHTAGNWDDNAVPTLATNVTIPTGVVNMPSINSGTANCNNLTLNGILTIGNATLNCNGNMAVSGNLTISNEFGILNIQGNAEWNSGSTASMVGNSEINVYGNWDFNAGSNVQLEAGSIFFRGTSSKVIRTYSSTSAFYSLWIYKLGGSFVSLSEYCTQPLRVNGLFEVETSSKFYSSSSQDIILKRNMYCAGVFQQEAGAVRFIGSNQEIRQRLGNYFNNIIIATTATVSIDPIITNIINIKGNLNIQSGVFAPGNSIINIAGDWSNYVGLDAFNETGSTVSFNGVANVQRIYNDENFDTFILNNTSRGGLVEIQAYNDIHCNYYDWISGGLSVIRGSFTAPNLADGVMGGDISVNTEGVISMGNISSTTNMIGRLFIHGGTFNILTSTESQWPGNGIAQLSMSGGELNVYPGGIKIVDNPPYNFVSNITGGTIRTEGSFINNRSDFNPTAGTVELYGPEDVTLGYSLSTLYSLNNLTINKTSLKDNGGIVTLTGHILLQNLNIEKGTLNRTTGKILAIVETAEVNNQGKLSFEPNTAFALYPGCQVSINEGGTFESIGTESQPIVVERMGDNGFYDFGVGGTISSRFTTFNHCGNIIVAPSGFIDPENAFYHCTFPVSVGPLLSIDNNQEISILGAHFPNLPNTNNVRKLFDTGRVTMLDATGPGAGSAFEYDPYNRIDWRASQPGLWTGAVSTDWHTAANWDDFNVPDESIDVLVPESVSSMNMPVINNNAICKNLLNYGQLTIQDQTLTVNEKLILFGHLNINKTVAVEGDFWCQEGSSATANTGSLIYCKGNMFFAAGSDVQLNNGVVIFSGDGNSIIKNNSITSYYNEIVCDKNSGAIVSFDASSGLPLRINGNLSVTDGSGFISTSGQSIVLKGHLISEGTFHCESGTFILNGNYHILTMSMNNYFHNLDFSMIGSASFTDIFSNTVTIKNDLIINSGVFSGGTAIINVGRDWKNNAGSGSFVAHQSKVIFDGNDPGENQFIYGGGSFNTIELRQHSDAKLTINDGAATICHKYDWTSGTLEVVNGVFNSYDLLDDRIAGNWILHNDGLIYLYDESTMGLGGNVTIYGGVFSVAGGQQYFSYWPSVSDASLVMSGGILEFNNQSIQIEENASCSFTSNITGGIIKTTGWFHAEHPGFNPTGGTVEIYGQSDGYVGSGNGSEFYNLRINKSTISPSVGMENAVVKKALTVDGGRINIMDGYTLSCLESLNLNDGWLEIYYGGILNMGNFSALNVADGAQLRTYGLPENRSLITGISPLSYYQITVADGGWISMRNTIIENLDETGLFIYNNAEVDVDNAFNGCIFRNGKSCNNALITINTNQDLVAENVEFDNVSKSRLYNVAKWVNSGSITFENYSGSFAGSAFEDDPYNRISWGDEFTTHPISLPAGWSGISSYVIPGQPALEDVFAPISNELIIAQTMTGMYFPGQNINTIGNWESHSAYKVKTSAGCTLTLTGDYETNMNVSLNAGWNLLPVVTPDGAPAADLLSPLNGFVIAKDVAGTGIYWPEYGINTMEYLLPGKAYFVLLTENGEVNYAGFKSTFTGSKNLSASLDLTAFNIQATPISHSIAILPSAIEAFVPGTLIGAYDQAGNCFGITKIGEGNNSITIFGDDPTTGEKDGFFEGEMVYFKTLTDFENLVSLETTFDQNLPQSDGLFTENGLSAITSFKASTGILGNNLFSNVKVFPNPSDGLVNISGIIPGTILTITDLQGKVLMEKIADSETFKFDLCGYQPGVYFIKIEQNGNNVFRKIVLR